MSDNSDFFNNMREEFLQKGSALADHELGIQTEEVVELRKEYPLKNTDLLSVEIINKDLPRKIKEKVREHQGNLKKIIYATAQYVEENRFDNIDDEIEKIDLSKIEKNKVQSLINAQKKVNYSFQTLDAGMEIFSRVNQGLLDKLKNNDFEDSKNGKMKKTSTYLANAILVFELTNFAIEHLENFSLIGVDEIEEIKKNVLMDLKDNEQRDKKLKEDACNISSQEMKATILSSVKGREGARKMIREKWETFTQRLNVLEEGVSNSKQMTAELRLVRDNARNQLDILQVIATIQALEKNLEVFEGLSFMKKINLAPLNAEEARDLLGLSLSD